MASRLVELVGYQQTKNHQREKTEEWGERAAQNEERRGWGNISGEHPGECRTAPVVTSWEETQCCWHVLQGSPRLQSWAAPCVASHWCWSADGSAASSLHGGLSHHCYREREVRGKQRESTRMSAVFSGQVWMQRWIVHRWRTASPGSAYCYCFNQPHCKDTPTDGGRGREH